MTTSKLIQPAEAVLHALRARVWRLAVAESCTGGLVCAALTEISGASDVFDRGFITYSNGAKTDLLGVAAEMIANNGAVSHAVAMAMANGARAESGADIAASITGVAGPTGGSAEKPVGLVYVGISVNHRTTTATRHVFEHNGRHAIRMAAAEVTFTAILAALDD